MNIIITGSSGFVGKNLVDYLRQKQKNVIEYSLRNNKTDNFPNEYVAIIHLAGKAHDLKNVSKPSVYYQVNTSLTKEVYDTFLNSSAEVFIYLSSVKAAADHLEEVLTENTAPSPKTHYGKSKLYAEEYIFSNKIPEGKRVYALRPCMIHGPNNKGNLNSLFNFVKRGIPYPLAAFDNNRSLLSVENLCFVIEELLEQKDIPFGIYNVADDQPLSTKRIIEIIGEVIQKPSIFWKINPELIKFIAKIGDILHLPINSEILQKLTENYVVSNQKLMVALGKKLPMSSENGLRKTIQSFLYVK